MKYNKDNTKTHKISVLIGNGFDIQVLNHLGVPTNTTYASFYNFINWKYGNRIRDNLIVRKMEEDKNLEYKNWSDFENTIKEIVKNEYQYLKNIQKPEEIQESEEIKESEEIQESKDKWVKFKKNWIEFKDKVEIYIKESHIDSIQNKEDLSKFSIDVIKKGYEEVYGNVNQDEFWEDFKISFEDFIEDFFNSWSSTKTKRREKAEGKIIGFLDGEYTRLLVKRYTPYLNQLQEYFCDFLNTIVTSKVLVELDELCKTTEKQKGGRKSNLPLDTLQSFEKDLADQNEYLEFGSEMTTSDRIDFTFFNFNYTPLFDNYINLAKENFEPTIYKSSKNNFYFEKYSRGLKSPQDMYTRLTTRIFHPHGYQHTPRSMLFGFDNLQQVQTDCSEKTKTDRSVESIRYFLKPYWAENDNKYKEYLDKSKLYIVFGHSIGESDKYWWKNIADSLKKNKSELIIYNYVYGKAEDTESKRDEIKKKFLRSAGLNPNSEQDIKERIFVVNFYPEKKRKAFSMSINKTKK